MLNWWYRFTRDQINFILIEIAIENLYTVSFQNGEHGVVDTNERRLRRESAQGFSSITTP